MLPVLTAALFHDFQNEKQFLPRYYIRQVLFVKVQVAVYQAHQEAVERGEWAHGHAGGELAEVRSGVVVTGQVGAQAEIVEATRRKGVSVGGVGVEVEAAEVRHPYPHATARLRYAVQFLHNPYHVIEVLDYMFANNGVERIIREGIGKHVEVP